MADDKLEVSTDGASVKVSSEGDGAGRLTTAFTDLVSPLTEGAGVIGDAIRFYRQKNAVRALTAAHKIAEEQNIPLKPVAPKFLVDWTEKASLEEEGDDDLTELWGGLLASEIKNTQPSHYLFKRILGELTNQHVEFLNWLIDFPNVSISSKMFDQIYLNFNNFVQMEKGVEEFSSTNQSSIFTLVSSVNSSGVKLIRFGFDEAKYYGVGRPPGLSSSVAKYIRYSENLVIGHLENLGLVETNYSSVEITDSNYTSKEKYIHFAVLGLTPVGRNFIKACHGVG